MNYEKDNESQDLDEAYDPASDPETFNQPLSYDEDAANLVPDFEKTAEGTVYLEEIRDGVLAKFQSDWESCSEHRQRVEEDLRIYSGFLKKKEFPYKGASNAHMPILLQAVQRLTSRIIAEVFGDWVNVVGVQPVGPDDEETAELLSRHANWQMRNETPDFFRQMDRVVTGFFLVGYTVIWSTYDLRRKQNRHVYLTPSEFVMPYSMISVYPDLSDLPHYTHVLRYYPVDVEAHRGVWEHIDDVLDSKPPGWDEEPDVQERESMGKMEGQEAPTDDTGPYKILKWEGWCKLPKQTEYRWTQVVIDFGTKKVLSLSLHEETDWRDRERYSREQLELEQYNEQLMAYGEQIAQQEAMVATLQLRDISGGLAPEDQPALARLGAAPEPMKPERPRWMVDDRSKPSPVKKVPLHMYSHGVCIENLVGNLGLGLGRIDGEYNKMGDTGLQQFSDAATLSNSWTIIKPSTLKLPDNFGARPGRVFNATGVSAKDLKNSIVEFRAPPANDQLLQLADRAHKYSEDASQSPGILSGDAGKSGETFRGLNTRLEQATRQLGLTAKRLSIPLKQMYQNNARLNAIHMDELQVFYVSDHLSNKLQQYSAPRELYERNYRVEFTSDMKFTSEAQRIAMADSLLQLPGVIPALQSNFSFAYEVLVELLQAKGQQKLIAALGSKPVPPPMFGMPSMPPAQPGMGAPPPQGAPNGVQETAAPPGARPE